MGRNVMNGCAAEKETAEVFVNGCGAIEMGGDVREVCDVGAVVEDDGGSGKDAAEQDADAADVIKRERESPLIIGAEVEGWEGSACIREELRKGEDSDFRSACGARCVEENGLGRWVRDGGKEREAGIDGEERKIPPPSSEKEGDVVDTWCLCNEKRDVGNLVNVGVELGKGKGVGFGKDGKVIGRIERSFFDRAFGQEALLSKPITRMDRINGWTG
jgi:hypothetical protein